MRVKTNEIEQFFESLDHPLKPALKRLREIVRSAIPGSSESIKWSGPTFAIDGADRLTINIHRDKLMMVLHRGAAKSSSPFTFVDPTGLVEMKGTDRGIVSFGSLADVEATQESITKIVDLWVRAGGGGI